VKSRQSISVDPPADKYSTALFRTGSRFLGRFVRPCISAAILPDLVVAISDAAKPIVLARLTPLSYRHRLNRSIDISQSRELGFVWLG
jgi:hypothetical protein